MASDTGDLEQRETQAHPESGGFALTFDQAHDLFRGGVWGTKEFRNWLARKDSDFAQVRDEDVDNEIDRLARERARLIEKQIDEGTFGQQQNDQQQ